MNVFRLIWSNLIVILVILQILSTVKNVQAQEVASQTSSQDELKKKDQNFNSDISSTNRAEIIELEELIVEGRSLKQPGYFDSTHSSTTLTRERLERSQASNIMEVLQEIPGVSIEGGPRAGGMKVDIRGFDSNEDVLIKIDGATQNFERYRYGIGLSIDPELLKQVEVTRGADSITKGSGALGGVIEMETIDARDLLRPDESWGFRGKFGHRFNNDGKHLTLTGFARPFEFLDVLVSGVKRETNVSISVENLPPVSVQKFPHGLVG
jgi:hemoglobin/transferrin/lactoferrin receptor protein